MDAVKQMIAKIKDNWDSILAAVAKYGVATVLLLLSYFQILLPYAETNRKFLENSIEALTQIKTDIHESRSDQKEFCAKATTAHDQQAESHRLQIEGLRQVIDKTKGG